MKLLLQNIENKFTIWRMICCEPLELNKTIEQTLSLVSGSFKIEIYDENAEKFIGINDYMCLKEMDKIRVKKILEKGKYFISN